MGYGFYEVIDISIMNRGTSQGKSSVVNGHCKFMCEVKWTSNFGNQGGEKGSKVSFVKYL